jgi:hypothetical protein
MIDLLLVDETTLAQNEGREPYTESLSLARRIQSLRSSVRHFASVSASNFRQGFQHLLTLSIVVLLYLGIRARQVLHLMGGWFQSMEYDGVHDGSS